MSNPEMNYFGSHSLKFLEIDLLMDQYLKGKPFVVVSGS